ncbi:ribosomal protein L23 [Mycoplasma haemofelis str. Langford 1]|uniref:50S ribosomal protein L23 n=2 Tax=Mycoplasma haemofelis TaxID=29501 RepID=F6FHD3_MYCHI|nr:50S ribosomal protein L23 [Mycoplasma haemofelis]AEG73763.1 50S ribosomal L23 [Mycoplasma haemofelis Ohio2]CBY93468.1 ribosomal protein L23 [Mycoplasma haemofelis str. Langford 1]
MEITSVILKPKITEKVQTMRALPNPKLSFYVNLNASKHQIAAAFESMFGVKPKSVNIINGKPSKARYSNRSRYNYTKAFKVAYITVSGADFSNLNKQVEEAAKE